MRLLEWLCLRVKYLQFKMAQRREMRRAKEQDPNVYPLW